MRDRDQRGRRPSVLAFIYDRLGRVSAWNWHDGYIQRLEGLFDWIDLLVEAHGSHQLRRIRQLTVVR